MDNLSAEKVQVEKKHSIGLIIFLVLMIVANSFTAFTYFTQADKIISLLPQTSPGLLKLLGLLAIINVALAIGVWFWKKWGVYGFYIIATIAFIINISLGFGIMGSIFGLAGAVILYLLTRKRWHFFS